MVNRHQVADRHPVADPHPVVEPVETTPAPHPPVADRHPVVEPVETTPAPHPPVVVPHPVVEPVETTPAPHPPVVVPHPVVEPVETTPAPHPPVVAPHPVVEPVETTPAPHPPVVAPHPVVEPGETTHTGRLHYLDGLRAALMLLGLVVHSSAVFSGSPLAPALGVSWSGWSYIQQFLGVWRMPAFFVLAGFFATLVLSRRPVMDWSRRRAMRLGIPLAVGMVTVNVVLSLARGWTSGRLAGGMPRQAWDEVVLPRMDTLAHLWFLAYLLAYSAALVVAVAAVRTWWPGTFKTRLEQWVLWLTGSFTAAVLVLLALTVPVARLALEVRQAGIVSLTDGNVQPKVVWHAVHFALGCGLGVSGIAMARLSRLAGIPTALFAAVTTAAAMYLVRHGPQGELQSWLLLGSRFLAGCACTVLLLGLVPPLRRPRRLGDSLAR